MKRANKLTSYLLLTIIFLFSFLTESCDKEKLSGEVVVDPQLISKLYAESKDTITFQSNKYILEAELYRDFFPGGPIPKTTPLIASIFLVNIDSLPVSADLEIKRLMVINNPQIWISSLNEGVQPNIPDYKLQKLNISGPTWDTGITVDVILEIQNKLTSEMLYIVARNQNIERLD